MNKTFFWSITAALAGLLFGFDTVVISGADQKLQEIWNTSDLVHGTVVMGMALWGTVLGAVLGGFPSNKFGRKTTLLGIGVLYFVSAIGSAFANDPLVFAIFRFVGGIGVGISTIAAPAYISEIAPAAKRGMLVSLYQFNIVLGILLAFISNFLLKDFGEHAWRWMLGVEAVPAAVYTVMTFIIPKSPRWLIDQGKAEQAQETLTQIYTASEVEEMLSQISVEQTESPHSESLFSQKYKWPLLLAFLIAFFNQTSGINAFLYYAPRIFEIAGLGSSTALLSSIGVGVANLVFTLFGVFLIDKLGRKTLMYIGSIGYIISLSLVSCAFFFEWQSMLVPIFLFAFIASHAIGQGAVIWVFISEIFPTHMRASGQAFGSTTHWVLAAIIPSMVPFLFSTIGAGTVFLFFAIMMVGQLLFVRFMMPETKGISLEELSHNLH